MGLLNLNFQILTHVPFEWPSSEARCGDGNRKAIGVCGSRRISFGKFSMEAVISYSPLVIYQFVEVVHHGVKSFSFGKLYGSS
jgi:hypothetical protein